MQTNRDNLTTREEVVKDGCKILTAQELKEIVSGNTVTGDYFYNNEWRLYIAYSTPNGEIEGVNDLGSFVEGRWSIEEDGKYSVEWDGYWEDWSAYAFHVDGKIKFYDSTTDKWRTSYTKVEAGELPLEL